MRNELKTHIQDKKSMEFGDRTLIPPPLNLRSYLLSMSNRTMAICFKAGIKLVVWLHDGL